MSICADGFQVVFVGQIGVRTSGEAGAKHIAHGFYNVLLPQETVPPARSKVADLQSRRAAEPLHFLPEFCLGSGIENIELEFAEALETGAGFQFAQGRERMNLPHGCFRPESAKGEGELAVLNRQLILRKAEAVFEPFEESGFEHAAASVKRVAGKPDEFGLVKTQFFGLIQLGTKLLEVDHIGEAQAGGTVNQGKRSGGFGELLPDELEHKEFVEIGVEQGSRNRIQLPIMVVGPPREVDDHDAPTLPHCGRSSETDPMARSNEIALVRLRPQTWRTSPSRATAS